VASGFWKSGEQDFENQGISRASVLNKRIIAFALTESDYYRPNIR
jgi:hypothetical protein